MPRHLNSGLILLLLTTLSLGCEGRAPWDDEEEPPAATAQPDFGPTAAYDRRLVFLGSGDELPTAAVFDFQALSDSVGIRRGVRVRLADGIEWIDAMDAGWEMAPMRDPWRLVPHGALRMIVDDDGELASLELRDDVPVLLQPGPVLAEHAPDAGTQLILRQAMLAIDGAARPGVLLDAQLGRRVGPGFFPRARTEAGATPDEEAAALDSLAVPASPTARPGTEALLLDTAGYYVVIASSATGRLAWAHAAGRDDIRPGLRLEPLETEPFVEAGVDVPVAWQLLSGTGDVLGELRAEAADRAVLTGPGDVTALGYVLVSGWVEDRQVRREVFGLVRDIR